MSKNRKVIIIVGVIVFAILLLAMLFYLNFRIHILRVTEISEKTLETSGNNENITYFMYVNNDTNIYKNFKKGIDKYNLMLYNINCSLVRTQLNSWC